MSNFALLPIVDVGCRKDSYLYTTTRHEKYFQDTVRLLRNIQKGVHIEYKFYNYIYNFMSWVGCPVVYNMLGANNLLGTTRFLINARMCLLKSTQQIRRGG